MEKFDLIEYVLCNRKTHEIITISTTSTLKAKACHDHGPNDRDWKIVEKKTVYRTEGIQTHLTKKQMLEILASFDDDEELPLLVDYSTYYSGVTSTYYFSDCDTNWGICYDAVERQFVTYAGEFEC